MKTGMMWFDNDPKTTLDTKICAAVEYYRHKYGAAPDVCFVNPRLLSEPESHVGQVVVKPMRAVLPGHLWIGVEEK